MASTGATSAGARFRGRRSRICRGCFTFPPEAGGTLSVRVTMESVMADALVSVFGMSEILVGMAVFAVFAFGAIASNHMEKRTEAEETAKRLEADLTRYNPPAMIMHKRSAGAASDYSTSPEYGLLRQFGSPRSARATRRISPVCAGLLWRDFSRSDLAPRPSRRRGRAAQQALVRKRADFLIIDRYAQSRLPSIEYQGDGHYLGATPMTAISPKRVACQKANIPLIEVPAAGLTRSAARSGTAPRTAPCPSG